MFETSIEIWLRSFQWLVCAVCLLITDNLPPLLALIKTCGSKKEFIGNICKYFKTNAPKCRTKCTFCKCTLFNEISDTEKDIIDIESGNDE